MPLLRAVDAVTVTVPSLDEGLSFYRDRLGLPLKWRNDSVGQAGLSVADSGTELVLALNLPYEPNWLVDSAEAAAAAFVAAGGLIVREAFNIPVGKAAVVADPFGNALVLIDLSKGKYVSEANGDVTGVE